MVDQSVQRRRAVVQQDNNVQLSLFLILSILYRFSGESVPNLDFYSNKEKVKVRSAV